MLRHAIFTVFSVTLWVGVPAWANDLSEPVDPDDFIAADLSKAKIGQLLFYDKILSGNRNISCGTCHHHDLAGTDGLSLGIGEGGQGLGRDRTPGYGSDRIVKRIPRNAPALWNLGHSSIDILFHDGRLSVSDLYGNGFDSPAEEWLPLGLDNIVAAQALFPLTSLAEMAGSPGENDIAGAVNDRIDAVWPIVAKRVRTIEAYGTLFVEAFETVETPEDVTIVEIGNALAAFITSEWQSFDSPYDQYLAGDRTALTGKQTRGMELFFGAAGCADCHNGPLLSDQEFHALGLPAFGPGRTRKFDPMPRDLGRMGKSDILADAYRFRTPMLRNVALTGPYGHNGAYPTLEAMVRHHLDADTALSRWTKADARLPDVPWLAAADFAIQQDRFEMDRQARARDLRPQPMADADIDALVAFLNALTGETAEIRPLGRPETVPSGLPVD
ncbi:MAG: cytochrome c peroxidase [Pseudomonadota bacterium]